MLVPLTCPNCRASCALPDDSRQVRQPADPEAVAKRDLTARDDSKRVFPGLGANQAGRAFQPDLLPA
jgi:hypothetical protein